MLLVYDIGTTALKGGVIDQAGALLARAQTPMEMVRGENPDFHEFDPATWLSGLRRVTAALLRDPSLGSGLRGVVISGNGPTLVPVGSSGRPVHCAINWMDRRGVEEAELISSITGSYVDPSFFLPKAYWIYRNKPKVYQRTRHFLSCPEYVDYVLTGEACTILPSPQFSRYIWTQEAIGKLGMEAEKFPPFIKPGQLIGRVRPKAAETLGLPEGLPVIAGGPDFIMSILGTATVRPGRTCDRAGSSEGVNLCSASPLEDPRLLCLPHIIEGYYNVSGLVSTTGKAVEWFKNSLRGSLEYEELFAEIARVPAGAGGLLFLPYLSGERSPLWDPRARGAFLGLSLKHGWREMGRAVVEAVGYAIRDVLEVMEEDGCKVEELRVTGGQARSPLLNQIKADVSGKRILVPRLRDADLLGDACVGLYGLGRFDSLSEAAELAVRIERSFEPAPRLKGRYDEMFALYREAYRGLKPVFERLGRLP